ncbi:uncharacterized protein B0H18DRAFT_1215836 [Fomitopsis serialis]|uniref:uncharacterized protein n=1 Tax=Fomitopsis serialis TaxID=139415 RepID=UPI002007EF19|nr:uncharacterized protein B0H18DRAFT_1215836 [Neoantrodia serialis]KAH9914680.1 hypothetical protein B0H18DRAFT_1215836 [Neoantrodia serialis]
MTKIKNEVSAGGGDPYFEAIHYYQEHVCIVLAACERAEITFEDKGDFWKINFPIVLVLHFGPYVDIAVATFADKLNVEHLTSFSVHAHPTNTQSDAPLRSWATRLLPFHDYYADAEGHRHEFEYLEALEDKRLFRARTKVDGKPLYVKFSTRYCKEAHRAAFESGFAPKLYAAEKVYDWTMIVMEDKSADYTSLWDAKYNKGGKHWTALEHVRAKVRDGLRSLHKQGYVHGDVRDVNVLVRNATAPKTQPAALLVDWDWAGEKSSARYPYRMNLVDVKRPDDARPGEEIKEAHDMWMADRI